MGWLVYAAASAFALGTADFLVKIAAGRVSNSLALLLFGCCTFLAGLGWVILDRARGLPQSGEPSAMLAAIGVGVAFSAVTIGLYLTYSAGAPISVASPIIRLGGVLVASVVGVAVLREPLTPRYLVGIALASAGVYLIIKR